MKAFWTSLLVLLALAGMGHGAPAAAGARDNLSAFKPTETRLGQAEVIVPARRLGDLLLVEASVDGRGPFTFILDTGAGAVFLSQEVAAQLPRKGKGTPVYSQEKGGERQIGRDVAVERLTLGGAEFKRFRALTVDFADLRAATGERIDGLLGFSLFADCLLTLDFPGARLVLGKGQLPKPNGEDVLPYTLEPGGTPQVILAAGDASLPATLDSGNVDALAIPKTSSLALAKGPVEGPLVASITGRRRRQVGRLAGVVRLGRYTLESAAVLEEEPAGRIGAGLLKFFTLTFDPASRTVRFARNGSPVVAASSPRTVGLGFTRMEDGWRVVDVIPNTPAVAAGIQVGDVLVSINGRPVSEVDYNRWQSLLQSETSLSLGLRRGEDRTQLTLPVGELVR